MRVFIPPEIEEIRDRLSKIEETLESLVEFAEEIRSSRKEI